MPGEDESASENEYEKDEGGVKEMNEPEKEEAMRMRVQARMIMRMVTGRICRLN